MDPSRPTPLPDRLLSWLSARHEPLVATEPLTGMSGNAVLRVVLQGESLVVKGSLHARERLFYMHCAPILLEHGLWAPQVWFESEEAGRNWLVLEDIPKALPRERWRNDAEMTRFLACLHTLPVATLASYAAYATGPRGPQT
jgi:hypothetical protein